MTHIHRNGIWICFLSAFVFVISSSVSQAAREPRAIPEAAISPLSVPLGLDDPTDTLFWDNGMTAYYFSYPDADDDSLFNVRFLSPDTCKLLGAWFMLYDQGSYGAPDFKILIWTMGADSFPHDLIGVDTLAWNDIHDFWPNWLYVPLDTLDLRFSADQWFHIGFIGIQHQPSDTVAVVSDNAVPNTPYSSLMWRGDWYTIQYLYNGYGYNLFIRALVDLGVSGVRILEPAGVPSAFRLDPPYPNPFNPTTTLHFSVTTAEPVQLTLHDPLGRIVATLIQGRMSPGEYSITVDASSWPSGSYFANLAQGQNRQVVRMVLVK
jgi:hypothetical protein